MSPWSELRNLNSSKKQKPRPGRAKQKPPPIFESDHHLVMWEHRQSRPKTPAPDPNVPGARNKSSEKKAPTLLQAPPGPRRAQSWCDLFRSGELRGTNIEHGARGPGGFFFARPGTQVGWFSRSKILVRSQLRQGRRPAAARSLGASDMRCF